MTLKRFMPMNMALPLPSAFAEELRDAVAAQARLADHDAGLAPDEAAKLLQAIVEPVDRESGEIRRQGQSEFCLGAEHRCARQNVGHARRYEVGDPRCACQEPGAAGTPRPPPADMR